MSLNEAVPFINMWLLLTTMFLAGARVLVTADNKAVPFDDDRFVFQPTPQNWEDASKSCLQSGNHLAFPWTKDEAGALLDIMDQNNVPQVHLGFHDHFTEGVFFTVLGRMINETNFNSWTLGSPTGQTTLNCGGFTGYGLVDGDCSVMLPSICQTAGRPRGFKDYDLIEGHGYYKLIPGGLLWPDAVKTCTEDGAHLLILNSEEEAIAVWKQYPYSITRFIYILVGAHKLFQSLYFVTVHDEPMESTGFAAWDQYEPNPGSLSTIVVLNDGVLIARTTGTKYAAVCEHSLTI